MQEGRICAASSGSHCIDSIDCFNSSVLRSLLRAPPGTCRRTRHRRGDRGRVKYHSLVLSRTAKRADLSIYFRGCITESTIDLDEA